MILYSNLKNKFECSVEQSLFKLFLDLKKTHVKEEPWMYCIGAIYIFFSKGTFSLRIMSVHPVHIWTKM